MSEVKEHKRAHKLSTQFKGTSESWRAYRRTRWVLRRPNFWRILPPRSTPPTISPSGLGGAFELRAQLMGALVLLYFAHCRSAIVL